MLGAEDFELLLTSGIEWNAPVAIVSLLLLAETK
jgi:hypothetical protein